MNLKNLPYLSLLGFLFLVLSCKKPDPRENIEGIKPVPYYGEVPTLKVQNYVNRTFIDLIGREPTDSEMVVYTNFLRANDLNIASRDSFAYKLQFSTDSSAGEGSYNEAYFHWFYEKAKGRFYKEYSGDDEFQEELSSLLDNASKDSLNGDSAEAKIKLDDARKIENLLNSKENYRNGEIGFREMMSYMINNNLYDLINMNTINMIDASFDNLFYRYPTLHERNEAFKMIEYNESIVFMGQTGTNKQDYVDIVTNSREFYNGMVLWVYKQLLSRDPESLEASYALKQLYEDRDLQKLQRQLIVSDEYAQFEPIYR